MKSCTKCGKRLPFSEFYTHPSTKDNLTSWCRYCTKSYAKGAKSFKPQKVLLPVDVTSPEKHKNIIWIKQYLQEWACGMCRTTEDLHLYTASEGAIIPDTFWIDFDEKVMKKALVNCEVWCSECAEKYFYVMSKIRKRNRRNYISTAIANTDVRIPLSDGQNLETIYINDCAVVSSKHDVYKFVLESIDCPICGEDRFDAKTFVYTTDLALNMGSKTSIYTLSIDTSSLSLFMGAIQNSSVICYNCWHCTTQAEQQKLGSIQIEIADCKVTQDD